MESHTSKPVIIASRADPASTSIAENLIKRFQFEKKQSSTPETRIYSKGNLSLVEIEEPGIYATSRDIPPEATTLIFASKHVSSSGKPALTVHTTGNPTHEALYGGNPEQLSHVDPSRVKKALQTLRRESAGAGLNIEISMEATHHGPTSFEIPVMFVEIGSGPKEWKDPVQGEAAAKAIKRRRDNRFQSHECRWVWWDPLLVQAYEDLHGGRARHRSRPFQTCFRQWHLRSNYQTSVRQDPQRVHYGCTTALLDWKGLNGKQRQAPTTTPRPMECPSQEMLTAEVN